MYIHYYVLVYVCGVCEYLEFAFGTVQNLALLLYRESLAAVQEHLESEKLNKSGVIKELEVLREKHQNEMTAREHARRLAEYVVMCTVRVTGCVLLCAV